MCPFFHAQRKPNRPTETLTEIDRDTHIQPNTFIETQRDISIENQRHRHTHTHIFTQIDRERETDRHTKSQPLSVKYIY